jgi:hypothetical protein
MIKDHIMRHASSSVGILSSTSISSMMLRRITPGAHMVKLERIVGTEIPQTIIVSVPAWAVTDLNVVYTAAVGRVTAAIPDHGFDVRVS